MRDTWENAKTIHGEIFTHDPNAIVRMEVRSKYFDDIKEKMKRGFYNKPMFANLQKWIIKTISKEDQAFALLAGHVELVGVKEGRMFRWTGNGGLVSPIDSQFSQDYALSHLGPFWISIQLGADISRFSELLDD